MGRFVGAGLLVLEEVHESLTRSALDVGLEQHEVERTILSGLEAGITEPHDVEQLSEELGRDKPGARASRKSPPLTDTGNAERLVRRHGDRIRYCHPWKKWLAWNGKRWSVDETANVMRMCKDVVRRIYGEASQAGDDAARTAIVRWGTRSESRADIARVATAGCRVITERRNS